MDFILGLLLRYVLPAAVLVGATSFGVHKYNEGIRKEAVASALSEERAQTTPIIDGLKTQLQVIKDASKAEADKQKAELARKTKEYKNALVQIESLEAQLSKQLVAADEFERLLNTIRDNNRAAGTGISPRYDALAAAHTQCERDLRESEEEGAATLVDLSRAIAIIDALKLK